MFKAANKSTLHDDVLSQMIDAISKGIWAPGDRLPGEQTLATQFEVSRNCIREVLKALALSGVIEARPGSGTFLSSNALRQLSGNKLVNAMFDETSLRELMEIRCLIEGQGAWWAAERATDEDIEELRKILEHGGSVIENHTLFHDTLARIAGNKLLTRFLESIRSELEMSKRRIRERRNEMLEEYALRHLKIYERLESRDPDGARKAMIDHIIAAWQDLIQEEERIGTIE